MHTLAGYVLRLSELPPVGASPCYAGEARLGIRCSGLIALSPLRIHATLRKNSCYGRSLTVSLRRARASAVCTPRARERLCRGRVFGGFCA